MRDLLPLVLVSLGILFAIGGAARLIFRPRGIMPAPRPLTIAYDRASLIAESAPRVSANPVREFRRDDISTNFGMF